MPFMWSITTENKLRSTWGNAHIESVSTEAVGYPSSNANDGNIESRWKASGTSGNIVIDTYETTPDIDYIFLRFDVADIPTSVKVETSASPGSGFTSIANNMDGTVATALSAACSGVSRVLGVDDATDIEVGNTVKIVDNASVVATAKFLVVDVGANYIEIDRYPGKYAVDSTVTVCANTHCLVSIASEERKRYIKVSITCGTVAHLYEISAFGVDYVFDDSALPLNPMPVEFGYETGTVTRTFGGYGIGRMTSSPAPRRFGFSVQRVLRDGLDIIESLLKGNVFGVLMDNGEWYEGLLTNPTGQRRQSSDAELVSYGMNLVFETM